MPDVDVHIERSQARLTAGEITLEADLTQGTFVVRRRGETVLPPAVSAVTFAGGEALRTDEMPHHTAAASDEGLEITHHAGPDAPVLVQRFRVEPASGGLLVELLLRVGDAPRAVAHLHHVVTQGEQGESSALEPGAGLWMWRFGTVSPGDPVLCLPLDSPNVPEAYDRGRWLIEGRERMGFTSEMLAVFQSNASARMCLLGFVTVCDQAAGFTVTRSRDAYDRVLVESRCDLEGLGVATGDECRAETLLILPEDDPWRAAETYARLLAARYTPRVLERPLVGWSDWQYYRREITEEDVLENVETLAAEEYPIQDVLVDDGYQRNMSDWLVPNDRFPHGIKWLAERIREKGFKPGIWIAPLTAHESSTLAREHPDWLVMEAHGQILTHHTHMGKVHAVDFTVPQALDWLRSLVRTLVHEYGYRWIKLDGPIRRYYDGGVFRHGPMTSVRHIRLTLEAIRDAAGDAIVEGEGYYGPSIGLVDTQRVTQDIQQDWPRLRHTAQVNLLSTFMHRTLWKNNPDAFILRDEPTPHYAPEGKPELVMTQHELETEVTALALSGGPAFLTDDMARLTDARKSYVDAFIPVYETPARPVDLFNGKPCPEVFHQKVRTDWEAYDVIAVFNWEDAPRVIEVPLDGIDLESAEYYVAFEYWTQTFLGTVQRTLDLGEIPAHGVRVTALRALRDHPFVMGTSLHITQGGVELRDQTWDETKRALRFSISSWAKCVRSVHIHVPDGFEPTHAVGTWRMCSPTHLVIEYAASARNVFEVSF